MAGKKAGKNKLALSSASDLQTSNTIYSVGAKTRNSKNERIFLKKQIFSLSFVLVSCFLVLNFAQREFYVFPVTGNTKVTGCWIFRLCAVRFSAKHLAASWRIDRDFCNSRKVFTSEMSKMICCDLAMGGRAEILQVWLYFRVWYAVAAKIVRWRYRKCQYFCIITKASNLFCRFLTDFLYRSLSPLNLQGNPFTIMSLSFLKLTVCARRYSHRRISKWSRLSAARLALDCRVGGRGFDFRGRTNTQCLKITEK